MNRNAMAVLSLVPDVVVAIFCGYVGPWWLGVLVFGYGIYNFHDGARQAAQALRR